MRSPCGLRRGLGRAPGLALAALLSLGRVPGPVSALLLSLGRVPALALAVLLSLAALPGPRAAGRDEPYRFSGLTRYRLLASSYPEDSLFRRLDGSSAADLDGDLRLTFGIDRGGFDFEAAWQLVALWGDTVRLTRELPPDLQPFFGRYPDDERRLFDLTRVLTDEGNFAALHRLDRLSVGYTVERGVVRFGRQAITWGNGLFYTPMDIFNPFDPAAVDKEFKSGDDMLYGQYLRKDGDDLQAVAVFRRDPADGALEADESSLALKYHGVAGSAEYDLLAARHFGDSLLGLGGNRSVGGAVWRGDLVLTFGDDDTVVSLVTSVSYSWTWWGRNVSGAAEYFYNGFGQTGGAYDPQSLAQNPALVERVTRGELFTLGRTYLALNGLVEVTPLFRVIPTLFTNLADSSALLQIATQNDLRQNLVLLGALNLPVGPGGTEFGGIASGLPGVYVSSGPGLFLQLGLYF